MGKWRKTGSWLARLPPRDFTKIMTGCETFEMSESMKRRLMAQPLNPLRKMRVTVMSSQSRKLDSSVESNSAEPARSSGLGKVDTGE